jgi:hypothetical protein
VTAVAGNGERSGFDAEAVAAAVEACPSVSRLTAGSGVEVATYLAGRRVRGVRLDGGTVEVHVAARYGAVLPDVAREVRAAVRLLTDAPVSVFIDDLDVPEPGEPTVPAAELPPPRP